MIYSYQDFVHDEENQLQKILTEAFSSGHRFISDQDARPKGSANAYGHLWDNGSDISEELVNVLKVRKKKFQLVQNVFPKLQKLDVILISPLLRLKPMKSQSKVFFAWGRLNLIDSVPDVLLKCVFNPK